MNALKLKVFVRLGFMAALVGALASTTGCVAAAVGAGVCYKKYRQGAIQSIERMPLDQSWAALQSAMTELGYKVTHRVKRFGYAAIKADAGGEKTIHVRLEPEMIDWTEIQVRVGIFGDEDISQAILAAVRRHNETKQHPDRDAMILLLASAR